MILFPVVMPTSEAVSKLKGKEKVALLSKTAREALKLSAEKSGMALGDLKKDKDDIPIPFDGNYWSLSHKSRCVAAVISRGGKVGIDIEEIKPRPALLFDYLAAEEEWELSGEKRSLNTFFRYWTAKEAVLKSMGKGIGDFKKCRVVSVSDKNHLTVEYRRRLFCVEQLSYQNHIISLAKDYNRIEWIILDS